MKRVEWRSNLTRLTFLAFLTFLGAYAILSLWSSLLTNFSELSGTQNKDRATKSRIGFTRINWTGVDIPGSGVKVDCKVKVALILCDDGERDGKGKAKGIVAEGFERQINQTLVLLKSILITMVKSEECVKVILITDQRKHFERIKERIFGKRDTWDIRFSSRLKLRFVPLKYPPGTSWMRRLFRPCATLRLFLPDLLSYDSVLYLDTDIIFLRSPEDLWSEFTSFNTTTLAAMSPCLFHYGTPRNSVPFYGSSGLNAGIMLMNLSRMRNTQWTHKIQMVGTQYRSQIKLADQDILNIYFHNFPEELHLLSCDWNFRHSQCHNRSHCRDKTMERNGISAIHGNALSFTHHGPEPLLYSIFKKFEIGFKFLKTSRSCAGFETSWKGRWPVTSPTKTDNVIRESYSQIGKFRRKEKKTTRMSDYDEE